MDGLLNSYKFNHAFRHLLIFLSLAIAPISTALIPSGKNGVIALLEFLSEIVIICSLARALRSSKQYDRDRRSDRALMLFFAALLLAFTADTLYSLRIFFLENTGETYDVIVECLYGCFSLLLTSSVIYGILGIKNWQRAWGWTGFLTFVFIFTMSVCLILIPYYGQPRPFVLYVNATCYAIFTSALFSAALPFAFRVAERKKYWFVQSILLFLVSDFALRYQTTFIKITTFSWAEFGWCTFFVAVAWIVTSSEKKDFFITGEASLAPAWSVRSLLTLAICGANISFLIGILLFRFSTVLNAEDISGILFLMYLFWLVSNEFAWRIANDFRLVMPALFKGTEQLSAAGLIQFKLEKVQVTTQIFEISKILNSYNGLVEQTNRMITSVERSNRDAAIANVASQVSHDIRSPLAALTFITSRLENVPEPTKLMIREATQRINDIANDLLFAKKADSEPDVARTEFISPIVDSLLSEKRIQLRTHIGIELQGDFQKAYGLFVNLSPVEFKQMLSDSIDNAVQAVGVFGIIHVAIRSTDNGVEISICDNGKKPTSSEHQRGFVKSSDLTERFGGTHTIAFAPDRGTTVTFSFPKALPPVWFVHELAISAEHTVIIVDDDQSIHGIWRDRFESLIQAAKTLEFSFFTSIDAFSAWQSGRTPRQVSNSTYLVDYEFSTGHENGLGLIARSALNPNAILVTSHAEDPIIIEGCERLGIKLLPKSMIGIVPIRPTPMSSCSKLAVDAVLIDDDDLVRMTWKMAASDAGVTLWCFESFELFINESSQVNFETPIYLDYHLGKAENGIEVGRKIADLGFSNISLATGLEAETITAVPWIRQVIGKEVPWLTRRSDGI